MIVDPLADIRREQESEHRAELKKLSDLAFVFLDAAGGDKDQAEHILDDMISLLFEDGVLSTWRYRLVLKYIRDGL